MVWQVAAQPPNCAGLAFSEASGSTQDDAVILALRMAVQEGLVCAAEVEDTLVRVAGDQRSRTRCDESLDELRCCRIEVVRIIHQNQLQFLPQFGDYPLAGGAGIHRVDHCVHELGGVEVIAFAQALQLLIAAEEFSSGGPHGTGELGTQLRQLFRAYSAFRGSQDEITQLAGEPHECQRGNHVCGPVVRAIFHLALEQDAQLGIVFRTRDEPRWIFPLFLADGAVHGECP